MLIGFTGDLPAAFPHLIPSILLSQSGYLSAFDVGTFLVLQLFMDFFVRVFFSFFLVLNRIAYVNTITSVFTYQISVKFIIIHCKEVT